MKKILFVASEGVPFIKTGGLADVVGSLPKCIDKEYFDVRVILPKYTCMKQEMKDKLTYKTHLLQIFCRSAPLYIWLNNGSLETTSYAVSQLICSVPSFDALYPNSDKSLVSDVQAITWPSIATLSEDFSSIICSKALRLFCLDPRFSYKAFKAL